MREECPKSSKVNWRVRRSQIGVGFVRGLPLKPHDVSSPKLGGDREARRIFPPAFAAVLKGAAPALIPRPCG